MRNIIILLIFLISISSFGLEIKGYKAYSPDWEIKGYPDNNKPFFKLYAHGGLKGMGCGAESLAFYNFALDLNIDALQDLITNWKSMAFPLAIYTLATYFPIVKETLVGAEYLADQIAQLKNFDCESAKKMIDTYNKRTSKIVEACVLKRLSDHSSHPISNIWTASQEEINKALKSAPESERAKAWSYCMNNATLLDALPDTSSINKYLKKHNPRKWVMCNYASKLGLTDLGTKYNATIPSSDLKTLAQVFALAVTPEFIIDSHTKRLMLKPIEVNGKTLDSATLQNIIKSSVDDDFADILSYLNRSYTLYMDRVKTKNNKYGIENTDRLLSEFAFIYHVNKALNNIWDGHNGDYELYARGKEKLDQYIRRLKKQYVLMKENVVRKLAREQIIKAKTLNKSKEQFGNMECD